MVVEILSVGTEILMGNITNTNASYLARQCAQLGLICRYQVTVGDNKDRLKETVKMAISRSDIVLITGGLGPTEDDLTKETVALAMGRELVMDDHSKERILEYFTKIGRTDITNNNWKQALIPQGAMVIDNHNGTAPGLIVTSNDENPKYVIMIPGPPNELYPMFENDVKPFLQSISPIVLYSEVVKVAGKGESWVEADIKDLIDSQSNPTIATYAKTGEVHLRVTASAKTQKKAKKLVEPMVLELKKRFKTAIYTTDESITLEDHLVALLKQYNLKISTAESCTGGLLAGRIVNVSGASNVFEESYVTYSDKAKHRLLNVSKKTLKKHTAVSKKTAKEMAKGAAKRSKADLAISVTGYAGPGDDEKVGLVYIGCYCKGKTKVSEFHFSGNREKIREHAVVRALNIARCVIMEKYGDTTHEK